MSKSEATLLRQTHEYLVFLQKSLNLFNQMRVRGRLPGEHKIAPSSNHGNKPNPAFLPFSIGCLPIHRRYEENCTGRQVVCTRFRN